MKHNREKIKNTCRWLRQHATPAEQKFWGLVRNRRFHGVKFYRQYAIEFYYEGIPEFFVADFCCYQCRLIVEIDGGIHRLQPKYDEFRTSIINDLGFRVIRFPNKMVLHNISTVEVTLQQVVKEQLTKISDAP